MIVIIAVDKGGLPIGKLGPSSGPVFTVNGLPLFRCYAFIRFCIYEAIPLLNKSEKREALKLFEEARTSERSDMSISGCEKEIILWRDNPMDLLQLELRWYALPYPYPLRLNLNVGTTHLRG